MAVTSQDVANEAIYMMGNNQSPVTGNAPNFDNSTAGVALKYLYAPCVATVARQYEWDFSRKQVALTLSGNVAPFPWTFEYLYPANGIQVWQIMPAGITDLNNPAPTTWSVGNALVTAVQKKVIWTNDAAALAVYNNNPTEDTWDALFRESVVRLLASELAIAIGGKPGVSQMLLESGGSLVGLAESRDS